MDASLLRQRIEQFEAKHGEWVVDDLWVRYADGAKRETDPLGLLAEPHQNPHQRAKDIAYYREIILKRVQARFKEFKQRLEFKMSESIRWATANAPPPPPTDAELADLEALRLLVVQRQTELEQARVAVTETVPAPIQERRKVADADSVRLAAIQHKLEGIKI